MFAVPWQSIAKDCYYFAAVVVGVYDDNDIIIIIVYVRVEA